MFANKALQVKKQFGVAVEGLTHSYRCRPLNL